jgi:anti-sigma regulatory factor (Ser/Thr protein kinase)
MVHVRRVFSSDRCQLADMRAFVREVCQRAWGADADTSPIAQLELALAEAAGNVMLHAYGGVPDRPIELVAEANDQQIAVAIYHWGQEFDPSQAAPPVFDGSKESGFGLYLMEQCVDEVTYLRDEQGRNGIRLVKKRSQDADEGEACS